MKKITVGGKEYTLEYTIGASLYDDCVTSVMQMLGSIAFTETQDAKDRLMSQMSVMGGVPRTTLNVLYAGLLEHHGTGEFAGDDSDRTVTGIADAKRIAATYIKEHKETGDGSFMDIFSLCLECMGDDDFLTLIGIDKMMETTNIPKVSKKRSRSKKETTEQ